VVSEIYPQTMGALSGHIALVTGGTRGIGRAIALRLAAGGADVAVASRSSDGAPVVGELEKLGVRALAVKGDVADSDAVRRLTEAVRQVLGPVDILVNNAAIADLGYRNAWEMAQGSWERMISVDLSGVYYCCAAVIPGMLSLGWGRIVNIASTSGISGGTSGAHYAAAKGGVIALSKALARELASRGITVNVVAPSKIDTEMFRSFTGAEERAAAIHKIPVGRLGRPEEIAEAVAYFAGAESGYTTGQVLVVSGGY
jgi:NAD(P)-dependent dehydrogenase (short-subunit alcohol dehydrogenase family)